jgi:hypothetical protein
MKINGDFSIKISWRLFVIKNIKKHYVRVCQHDSNGSGLDGRAWPSLYNNNNKKTKKIKKNSKGHFKEISWFSRMFFYQFCSILGLHCNIWTWYKILDYLWNCFFKKSLFQKHKKNILFSCIRPNPKICPSILL